MQTRFSPHRALAWAFVVFTMSACGKSGASAVDAPQAPAPAPAPAPTPAAAEPPAPAAAAAPSGVEPKPEGEPSAVLRGTGIVAKVWFVPAKPKVGQIFTACTQIADESGAPLNADSVHVDATMPSHGHGMMTEPQHRRGADCWLTEGMKLHMHGPWELSVHTESAGTKLRATANWEQPPEAL